MEEGISVAVGAQTSGDRVFRKIVSTVYTVDIRNLHTTETAAADGRHLELALRAEVKRRCDLG